MKKSKIKVIMALLILTFSAYVITACDFLFEAEILGPNLDATLETDYFTIDYPEEWYVVEEDGDVMGEGTQIFIASENIDPEDLFEDIPEEGQSIYAEYFAGWDYNEDQFNVHVDNMENTYKAIYDVKREDDMKIDGHIAHKIQVHEEGDFKLDFLFVFNNNYPQTFQYTASEDLYSESLSSAIFESIEFK